MEWREQVAVVTGGARGLGRATARLLAQRGAAVCVNYAAHADAAEALIAEIAAAGGRAIAIRQDPHRLVAVHRLRRSADWRLHAGCLMRAFRGEDPWRRRDRGGE